VAETVRFHRKALTDLVRGPWTQFWIAAPEIHGDALALLLPYLSRNGASVRVLTSLIPSRVADGKVDLDALQALRSLPNCEVRSLAALASCLYAAGPDGPALVTGAPLTLDGLDSDRAYGVLVDASAPVLADLESWWAVARPYGPADWTALALETSQRLEARSLNDEIGRIGAFVRVSVRGTRRTRRLDPKEFGVAAGDWGRLVRPVEFAMYKLDDVIRAKDDLEAVLADRGLEWNGYYLVPRHFLEHEWPRLFAAREKQLRDRLQSEEGKAVLKAQLGQARRELEAFFGEIYQRAATGDMPAETWIDVQVTRLLTETLSSTVLEESGLEYRVLTILPEDPRSVDELQRLLQEPKLRSLQLTFHI